MTAEASAWFGGEALNSIALWMGAHNAFCDHDA
jgi:hypothetical protein